MKIVLFLLITIVLIVDFISLNKCNKKILSAYIIIVVMIVSVSLVHEIDFFEISPLELGIKNFSP